MCTRSPDVSPLAVSNILDSCYQSWEADGSLHCQQGEVTNYFYVLAFFLRMRVVTLSVFQVSDFSFFAIGIPSSCATLASYLFLEELKRKRSPLLKRQNGNFLGGVTAVLPKFCLLGWLLGSVLAQNGDLTNLHYLLAYKPDSWFQFLLWAKHEWSAWFLPCIHRPCTASILQSALLGKHKYPWMIIHNLKCY